MKLRIETHPTTFFHTLKPRVVPIIVAIITWLLVLLIVGIVVRINSVSISSFIPLFVVTLLFWPIFKAAPWRGDLSSRVDNWMKERRSALILLIVLVVIPAIQIVPDLLTTVLRLPFRASGMFFGAALFYREQFGHIVGQGLVRFGQWYFQLFWLYYISIGIIGLTRRFR